MKVSLALTHHNRFDLILDSITAVRDDPRIREIVISDDASDDGSWEQLWKEFGDDPKFKLCRNNRNVGCYANKKRAIVRSHGPWVILFDSDNVMKPDYLDALEAEEPWDSKTAYLPTFAFPHFDYRKFDRLVVSRGNVAQYMGDDTFRTALNTANCLFNRTEFLRTHVNNVEPHTSDSIYTNLCWLSGGNSLKFVPNLIYFHRVHDGSHYKQNHHKTGHFEQDVEQALREMRDVTP